MAELKRSNLFPMNDPHPSGVVCVNRKLSHRKIWYFNRYSDIEHILTQRDLFIRGEVDTNWLERWWDKLRSLVEPVELSFARVDPPDHTRLRQVVSEAFKPRNINQLEAKVQSIVDGVLNEIAHKPQIDIIRDFAQPIPARVIIEFLGLPGGFESAFSNFASSFDKPQNKFKGLWEFRQFRQRSQQIYADQFKEPGDGLVTVIVEHEKSGHISRHEAVEMLNLLLLAGFVTTTSFIATSVLALLLQPEQQTRVHREGGLQASEIEEFLRFSSVLNFPRALCANRDVELGGVLVRKNDMVVVELTRGNLDPDKFSDPEYLDLDRRPNKHLTFGLGLHACIGAPLARLEGKVALDSLFCRYPQMELACDPSSLQILKSALNIDSLTHLPVHLGQES